MKRREVLEIVGGAGVVGGSMLAGCLNAADDTCETDAAGHRWCYGSGGELDAVVEGTLFARERHTDPGGPNDSVVGLDAETGERLWSYESATGGQDSYSDLTVRDGVYVSLCSDDDCLHLHALETDGEERWTRDIDAGHRRPLVADGVVYVASDTGLVRALEAATGETRWEHQEPAGPRLSVVEVADAVYVETDTGVVAIDLEGNTDWRYDLDGESGPIVLDTVVSDGVAYLVTTGFVAAVAGGDESWRREFDGSGIGTQSDIVGIVSGRLVVLANTDGREYRLDAFDTATGERDWMSDALEHPSEEYNPLVDTHDGVVYVGTDRLRALDPATGSEHWGVTLDDGPVQSVSAAGDGTVFVHAGETQLASFDRDGERLWEGSVDGGVRNYLVGDLVFVATNEAMYALER